MLIGTQPLRALDEILGDQPEWMRVKSLTYSKSEPLDVGELIVTLGSKKRRDYWFPVHWWVYEKFIRLARNVSRLAALRYLQKYIRANFGYRGQWPDNFYYKAFHIVRDPVVVSGSRAGIGKWPVPVSQAYQTTMATMKAKKPDTPAQVSKKLKRGAELMRRDDEYATKQALAKKKPKPAPDKKRPLGGKEADMKNKAKKPQKESVATLPYEEPILATQIAARVGLSVEQVGQALYMFRAGQTIESVATHLGVPSGQAELTQRLLAVYGNGVRMNESIVDSMIEEIEAGGDPDEVVDGDDGANDRFKHLYTYDGESSDAYVYDAELICPECADKVKDKLPAPEDPDAEETFDSDDYPKGPYADGGGEADTPQHCGMCGMFLGNPLTPTGMEYVQQAVSAGSGDPKVLDMWADFYHIKHNVGGCSSCNEDGLEIRTFEGMPLCKECAEWYDYDWDGQDSKKREAKVSEAGPTCHFCKRSGAGVQFAMFNPRFKPFGTACVDCEKSLPPDTPAPQVAPPAPKKKAQPRLDKWLQQKSQQKPPSGES